MSVASVYRVASGEQGVPVAPLVHTVIIAPATGRPLVPNAMSSFREPCAEALDAIRLKRASIIPACEKFRANDRFEVIVVPFLA